LESLFTKAVRSERYNFYMAYIVQRKNSHPEKERRKKNRANNRKKKFLQPTCSPAPMLTAWNFPNRKAPTEDLRAQLPKPSREGNGKNSNRAETNRLDGEPNWPHSSRPSVAAHVPTLPRRCSICRVKYFAVASHACLVADFVRSAPNSSRPRSSAIVRHHLRPLPVRQRRHRRRRIRGATTSPYSSKAKLIPNNPVEQPLHHPALRRLAPPTTDASLLIAAMRQPASPWSSALVTSFSCSPFSTMSHWSRLSPAQIDSCRRHRLAFFQSSLLGCSTSGSMGSRPKNSSRTVRPTPQTSAAMAPRGSACA
jgi:hypothetical protein